MPPCPTLKEDFKRFLMTTLGLWKREYQLGRKSRLKFYPFEVTHSLTNIFVEELRRRGIWNRGQRPENKCDRYLFPEGWRW